MVTYRSDDDIVEVYNGSSFVPVGGILQVVSTTKTNTFSVTTQTFTDITGLSASITPKLASSKILVLLDTKLGNQDASGSVVHLRLMRDSTEISVGDAAGDRIRTSLTTQTRGITPNVMLSGVVNFFDSPNTTSSITYKAQIRSGGGPGPRTLYVNRSSEDVDGIDNGRAASSITLMEVAS
jgi:hypothetical protein